MKLKLYYFLILLISSCTSLKERKILKEFPGYYKQLRAEGKFDSDTLTDYFYILTPDKKLEKQTSRCVLIFGNEENGRKKLVFDDLLPIAMMSGKIDVPFEIVLLSQDTLFVRFLISEYGHNEFYQESFTFSFNIEKQFFSLVKFDEEICILPDCEFTASITIDKNGLVNSDLPFSFENWLISGGYLSSDNVLIPEYDIPKWIQFSEELEQIEELQYQLEATKQLILRRD